MKLPQEAVVGVTPICSITFVNNGNNNNIINNLPSSYYHHLVSLQHYRLLLLCVVVLELIMARTCNTVTLNGSTTTSDTGRGGSKYKVSVAKNTDACVDDIYSYFDKRFL